MNERETTPSQPDDETIKEEKALTRFKHEIGDIKQRKIPKDPKNRAHTLIDAVKIYGLHGDQALVKKPVEGRQEVMVEDDQVAQLLANGENILKEVGKPKKPYQEGDIIVLTPDELDPIEVEIVKIEKKQKSHTALTVRLHKPKIETPEST